jgi:hypothetical protein
MWDASDPGSFTMSYTLSRYACVWSLTSPSSSSLRSSQHGKAIQRWVTRRRGLDFWPAIQTWCCPDDSDLRHPLFTLTVHLYTFILLPLLHSLWLLTGTGNANFFYAATMVHGLNSSLAVVDVMGAALRRDVKDKAKVLGEGESVQFTRA